MTVNHSERATTTTTSCPDCKVLCSIVDGQADTIGELQKDALKWDREVKRLAALLDAQGVEG